MSWANKVWLLEKEHGKMQMQKKWIVLHYAPVLDSVQNDINSYKNNI